MFYKAELQQFQLHVDWQDIPPERPPASAASIRSTISRWPTSSNRENAAKLSIN